MTSGNPWAPWGMLQELATLQARRHRLWAGASDRERDDVGSRGEWLPRVDIYQAPERQLVLKAELPGLNRSDIDLTVDNNTLTIRGERKRDDDAAGRRYHRAERAYGAFTRSFTLPDTIDGAKVHAAYRDGVLTVSLPVRDQARARQIEVSTPE